MTHRIADTFYDALSKLTAQEQKAVKTTVFDFQMDASLPGLSMHRVDRARDPNFWTARVNRDIRMVIHKRDQDTLLAWVGHHDDAYRWAETRRIESHPKTGAIQIVEARETVEDIVIPNYVQEDIPMPRLFADESDDTLLSWGIPTDWLETVRAVTDETILDIAGYLPAEAAEAIVQAATGVRPTPAEPIAASADPWSHPDAERRFRVMDNLEELKAALDSPWEKWSVFLHPAQREFVDQDFNGPARVIGSAGTGKTVVALHRAVRLAKSENARVMLATFNENLARRLAEKVPLIANSAVTERIEVVALQAAIAEQYREQFGSFEIATDQELKQLLQAAADQQGNPVDRDFLFDEWSLIVDAWNVQSADEYRDLPRLGRKVRMAASRKDELWKVFQAARSSLAGLGKKTVAQLAHELRHNGTWPYTNVLVDEAQDISVPELLLLGEKLGDAQNGLFFAGDIGQRIFRAPFPWSATQVEVRGRSRSLKVNYRTSHQIRMGSETLLPETLVEADGAEESRLGVTSVFEGPWPTVRSFKDRSDEMTGVSGWIAELVASGLAEDEIAVLVRTEVLLDELSGSWLKDFPKLNWLSMHAAKGSEFQAVAVISLDQSVLPDEERLLAAKDESQLDEVMSTERHLLYVAATRARDHLWLSGVDPVSEFVMDLMDQTAGREVP